MNTLTTNEIKLVIDSWDKVIKKEPLAGVFFYSKLFAIAPELRILFSEDLEKQYSKLTDTLTYIVSRLSELEQITDEIQILAKKHKQYGVNPENFLPVGVALIWTLSNILNDEWSDEHERIWVKLYQILSDAMQQSLKTFSN